MFEKLFETKKITLQKYKTIFVTVDNVQHDGEEYNWAIADRLRFSVPEYIMADIKSDGYIQDEKKIMYLLSNIISIEWKLVKEIVVDDNFNPYQIFITTKELEESIKEDF